MTNALDASTMENLDALVEHTLGLGEISNNEQEITNNEVGGLTFKYTLGPIAIGIRVSVAKKTPP